MVKEDVCAKNAFCVIYGTEFKSKVLVWGFFHVAFQGHVCLN